MKLNYRKVEFHVSPQTMVKRLDRQPWEKMLNHDDLTFPEKDFKERSCQFSISKTKKNKRKRRRRFHTSKNISGKKP
jgi:hypothetical protein